MGCRYRLAHLNDAVKTLPLMHEVYLESQYTRIELNPRDAVAGVISHVLDDESVVILAIDNDEIVGMLVGCTHEAFFNFEVPYVTNTMFHVRKDYRGKLVGARLLKLFIEWAKDRGIDDVRIGISSGIDTDRTIALVKKLGFEDYTTVLKKVN